MADDGGFATIVLPRVWDRKNSRCCIIEVAALDRIDSANELISILRMYEAVRVA
jgi:hypothetical protein